MRSNRPAPGRIPQLPHRISADRRRERPVPLSPLVPNTAGHGQSPWYCLSRKYLQWNSTAPPYHYQWINTWFFLSPHLVNSKPCHSEVRRKTRRGNLLALFAEMRCSIKHRTGRLPRPFGPRNDRTLTTLFQLFPLRYGQFVAAVIFGIFRVALDPMVVQFVHLRQIQQDFPQIRV